MIKYRKATVYDVAELAQMRIDMICEGPGCSRDSIRQLLVNTREYLAKGLAENSLCLWMAEDDGHLVAMSCLNVFCLPPNDRCVSGKTAYLGNMYTHPDYRRRGIAKVLLARNFGEARKRGIERLILNPTEVGKHLYVASGFEPWSEALVSYPLRELGSACGMPGRYGQQQGPVQAAMPRVSERRKTAGINCK